MKILHPWIPHVQGDSNYTEDEQHEVKCTQLKSRNIAIKILR